MSEEVTEEPTLPNTLPGEIFIVASQNIAHGGRSEWMGTQGKYQFTRGGVYKINHPIDVAYFLGNPKPGLEVYLDKPVGEVIDYSYPDDKIDVNADRGGKKGSILEEAQKRYERLL